MQTGINASQRLAERKEKSYYQNGSEKSLKVYSDDWAHKLYEIPG